VPRAKFRVSPGSPRTLLVVLAVLLAGCGGAATPKRVPELRGERLDFAEGKLEARGLDWEEIGGGNLGVVVRSHWYVCAQEPAPGKKATTVKLVVERSCPTSDFVLPDVVGLSLEDAEDELEGLGIPYEVQPADGDLPRVRHLWQVCYQSPDAGQRASAVRLYVSRLDCD
jgi:beta-lactam-binding protein with PASTA domain